MNAILVFDPSNDLLFANSNKLFRLQVLKYSKLNGLIAGSPIVDGAAAAATKSTFSSSSSISSTSSGSSPCRGNSNSTSNCNTNERPTNVAAAAHACRPIGSTWLPHRPRRHQRQPAVAASTSNLAAGGRPPRRKHHLGAAGQSDPPGSLAAGRKLPDDTNKRYLEVLMLLLTPYVASLRLSSSVQQARVAQRDSPGGQKAAPSRTKVHMKPHERAESGSRKKEIGGDQEEEEEDLLNKFYSSISINHECNDGDDNDDGEREERSGQPPVCAPENHLLAGSSGAEFSPRRFASVPLPVECLENCQIVYCELYDFIFIYMQELEQVSSFKMRLLQKRIDLFARLALILFGPSLNSLRHHRPQNDYSPDAAAAPNPVVQSQILRQAYNVWLDLQFEASFLLEAQERLIVSKSIEKLCQETLHKVSVHLRRPSSLGAGCSADSREIHMHSFLYSGTKLISSYSCRNSQQINADDLVLLLLLLKTFNLQHDNELAMGQVDEICGDRKLEMAEALRAFDDSPHRFSSHGGAQEAPDYCYASNYNANRHTYEINSTTTPTNSHTTISSSVSGLPVKKRRPGSDAAGRRGRRRRTSKLDRDNEMHSVVGQNKIPSQFLVFLSTGGKFKERLRVPHMIRFVPLTGGITLMLISEIPTSFLSLQMNRILKILLELSRQKSIVDLKLNQLAKINDCVCAIKTYFYGLNYEFRSSQYQRRLPPANSKASQQSATKRGIHDESQQRPCQPEVAETGRQQARGVLSSWFGKYLNNSATNTAKQQEQLDHNETAKNLNLFDNLQGIERRQCCQLMSRLEDLISNNIHTYMRRTFNLPVDERKREALINSTAATLRDSMNTFVVAPQLAKLNADNGQYLRQFGELLDEVKLMVREELSDYLDYLAVKSGCNITMGAPITHDMPAIKSFIYVDRSRQELLVSPLKPSTTKMDRQAMLEADFCGSLLAGSGGWTGRSMDDDNEDDGRNDTHHGSDDSSELDSADESRADEADCEADQGESDSSAGSRSLSSSLSSLNLGFNLPRELDGPSKKLMFPAGSNQASGRRLQAGADGLASVDSRWRLGASGDLLVEGRSPSSSGRSLATNNSSSWTSDIQMLATKNHRVSTEELLRDLASGSASGFKQQQQQQHHHLVDENLMKGFTCFVYNRLANGRTSYTSNDGTYVYSYFLWFKRNSGGVVKVEPNRKSEVAKKLVANYDSLPSVVCDDFFNSYANCLFGQKPTAVNTKASAQRSAGRNQIRIACQISQMDGLHGRRLIKQHLTQVKEEEEVDEDEDCIDYQCSLTMQDRQAETTGRGSMAGSSSASRQSGSKADGDDFHMFLRSQMSGRTGRSRVRVYQGTRTSPTKRPPPPPPPPGERGSGSGRPEAPKCYELFCVHDVGLLVHRNQILVEAERLAQRLAQLTSE